MFGRLLSRQGAVVATVCAKAFAVPHLGAQDSDVLRGSVFGPDSALLPGETISASGQHSGNSRTARTDARDSLTFAGSGDSYIGTVRLIGNGRRPARCFGSHLSWRCPQWISSDPPAPIQPRTGGYFLREVVHSPPSNREGPDGRSCPSRSTISVSDFERMRAAALVFGVEFKAESE